MREMERAGKRNVPARRKKKRRRSPFLGVFLLFLLAAAGAAVSILVFFRVSSIEVVGSSPYTQEQVAAASGIRMGGNLLAVNVGATEKRLCEKLPYLKTAVVRLCPLSTVRITVQKDAAFCYIPSAGGNYILDEKLKLLENTAKTDKLGGLPKITGAAVAKAAEGQSLAFSSQGTAQFIRDIAAAAQENHISAAQITSIGVGDAENLTLRYGDRVDILLGADESLSYRMKMALYVIGLRSKTEHGKLDVSDVEPNSSNGAYFDVEGG